MEDVTCAKPSGDLEDSGSSQWTPYTSPKASQPQPPVIDYVKEVSRQRVLLCECMAPLGDLYSKTSITTADLQQSNAKTIRELLKWKEDLPEALKVDIQDKTAPYLPHVLLLHMHYHQSIIHAHRPWMSKTYVQPHPSQAPGSAHARQTCVDAAISIAKLLEAYESRYTFRRINTQGPATTCSAALLLIFADVSQYGRAQGLHIAPYLGICFRALEEFGQSWESAKRARDFLIKLQRQWELKARSRRKIRRSSGYTKAPSYTSRKRPLTATDFESNMMNSKAAWPRQQQQQQQEQSMQDLEQQPRRRRQDSDDSIGPDYEMDFDRILEANEQAVSGKWTTSQSSGSLPYDLMGFLGDSYPS
ncbi:hypothetical protein N0V83_006466 [Neocucurbitaria cava]|uniref:Uncharacterized protein n=1 Tax=Neocucurbitaria cava TaxID=798079 RepID=A0A9W8Y837_9PLEO|nr:hypothetical protein N0V83_006466 [Neocucurbitaria cava]